MFFVIIIVSRSTLGIRIVLFLTILVLEFSIVSLFSLYSEQTPDSRPTDFFLVALGTTVELATGPSLAISLWAWKGLIPITCVGTVGLLLALLLVWRFFI